MVITIPFCRFYSYFYELGYPPKTSDQIGYIKNKLLGLFPADARVGN